MVNTPEKNAAEVNDKENGKTATSPDKPKTTEVDKKLRELEDPLCSPNNIQKISFQDVTTAAFLIKGGVEYTPCPVMIRFLLLTRRVVVWKRIYILEIPIVWSIWYVNLS